MAARFEIVVSEGVKEDVKALRAYDRQMILDAIETQLRHTPTTASKQRKLLHNLVPPFDAIPPIWQLRVGPFRVFYDVQETEHQVSVRAIRRKPAHQQTEEIL